MCYNGSMTKTNTIQSTEQELLASLRADAEARRTEDHTRQSEAHAEVVADLMAAESRNAHDFQVITAHAQAAFLHMIALDTSHKGDADRAWEATMAAAEIDGSV